jgi:hypothetical protein
MTTCRSQHQTPSGKSIRVKLPDTGKEYSVEEPMVRSVTVLAWLIVAVTNRRFGAIWD